MPQLISNYLDNIIMSKNKKSIDESLRASGVTIAEYSAKCMFGTIIHADLVKDILSEVLKILNSSFYKSYDYSLAGRISNGKQAKIELDKAAGCIVEFKDIVEKLSHVYVERFFSTVYGDSKIFSGRCNLHDMWIVEQKKNDYNPLHIHNNQSPAGLSGVLYLETPECISEYSRYKNAQQSESFVVEQGRCENSGWINLDYGSQTSPDLNNFKMPEKISIPPVPGYCILFPQDTAHQVYPFDGDGSRICISFNVNVWYDQTGITQWSDILLANKNKSI